MAKQPARGSSRSSSATRVQIKNPVTKHWVKLDTRTGKIVDTKKSPGPFKNIPKR